MVWDLQKPASNNDGRCQQIDKNLQKHKFHEISAIKKKNQVYFYVLNTQEFYNTWLNTAFLQLGSKEGLSLCSIASRRLM